MIRLWLLILCFPLTMLGLGACSPQSSGGGNLAASGENMPKAVPVSNTPSGGQGTLIDLSIVAKVGERIRTRRQLTVEEATKEGIRLSTSFEEAYVQKTLEVSPRGTPTLARRDYERVETKTVTPGAQPQVIKGSLEGASVEIAETASGLQVRFLEGSEARKDEAEKILLHSFDQSFLPVAPARVGSSWKIELDDTNPLSRFLRALGMDARKNEVRCKLARMNEATAIVEVDWRPIGQVGSSAEMIFRLAGEMRIDTEKQRVVSLSLDGGSSDGKGNVRQQITFLIEREEASGWYR